jgi:hypothetical protein
MTLQYLEALKGLGQSPSTKFIIPTEFTELADRIAGYTQRGLAAGARQDSAPSSEPTGNS